MRRIEAGLLSLATLATSSVSAFATEQPRLPQTPQVSIARRAPLEDPMAGADSNACINPAEVFELGAIDNGTFSDGMRILNSIGSYYFQRNVGPIEQQLARATQYDASLANCSADDFRVAAYMLNTQFPDIQIEEEPLSPLRISSRSFATAEVRRGLERTTRDGQRSTL